jgi:signal transduction histidine kinase
MLRIINKSVDYADKIVRDLQDYSILRRPLVETTDVNILLKDVLSQVSVPENVKFTTDLAPLPQIEIDRDMMQRVFLNLVANGVHAIENGGTLEISTRKNMRSIEVSFKDTGVGIPKRNMTQIFEPFFTTKAKGLGMGLPICKKFVESHGGSIEVESEEDNGSTFTVRLPIQEQR